VRLIAIGWLVLFACGRVGFEHHAPADAAFGDARVAASDAVSDGAEACVYLPSCQINQVTCCVASQRSCISVIATCSGTVAACDILTQQGCPPRSACCSTPQIPEPRCYPPTAPQPC
jgi:hypothetical protein